MLRSTGLSTSFSSVLVLLPLSGFGTGNIDVKYWETCTGWGSRDALRPPLEGFPSETECSASFTEEKRVLRVPKQRA